PIEGRLPGRDRTGDRVDAPDALSEQLREPHRTIGGDIAAIGNRAREPDLRGVGGRQAIIRELRGCRVEAGGVVRLRECEPNVPCGIETESMWIRALVITDLRQRIVGENAAVDVESRPRG